MQQLGTNSKTFQRMSHFISQYFVGILQLLQNDKISKIIKLKWSTNLNWLKNLKLDGSIKSFFYFFWKNFFKEAVVEAILEIISVTESLSTFNIIFKTKLRA